MEQGAWSAEPEIRSQTSEVRSRKASVTCVACVRALCGVGHTLSAISHQLDEFWISDCGLRGTANAKGKRDKGREQGVRERNSIQQQRVRLTMGSRVLVLERHTFVNASFLMVRLD